MNLPWPDSPEEKVRFLEMLTMSSKSYESILLTSEIRNLPSPGPGKGMMARLLKEAPRAKRIVKAFKPQSVKDHVAHLLSRENSE